MISAVRHPVSPVTVAWWPGAAQPLATMNDRSRVGSVSPRPRPGSPARRSSTARRCAISRIAGHSAGAPGIVPSVRLMSTASGDSPTSTWTPMQVEEPPEKPSSMVVSSMARQVSHARGCGLMRSSREVHCPAVVVWTAVGSAVAACCAEEDPESFESLDWEQAAASRGRPTAPRPSTSRRAGSPEREGYVFLMPPSSPGPAPSVQNTAGQLPSPRLPRPEVSRGSRAGPGCERGGAAST